MFKILCKLGIHRYKKVQGQDYSILTGKITISHCRICKWCNKIILDKIETI